MLKFITLFLFALYCNCSSAQVMQFDITAQVPGTSSPVITSWQNEDGVLFIWNKRINVTDQWEPRPIWAYRIERDGDKIIDSGSVYIMPTIKGRKDVVPYGIVVIGEKLYALMLVKIDEVTDDVYADEIETHDFSLTGNPFKLFQFKHAEMYNYGFLTMIQSDDQSKTLFVITEVNDHHSLPVTHTIAYSSDLRKPVWDRKDTIPFGFTPGLGYSVRPVIGNSGVVAFYSTLPIYSATKRFADDKNTKVILFITTITQKGIIHRKIPVKECCVMDLRAVVTPDNKLICCGFLNYSKYSLKSEGIFYISVDPEVEKYSEIKIVDFKKQTAPAIESLTAYVICNLLVSKEGAVWIIGEKQYGVNSSSTYGNLFVGIFDPKGNFKSALLIDKTVKVRQPGVSYFVARPTFVAQVYNENLYCFYTDENVGLTAATVTPRGELKYDRLKPSKPADALPADDAYFCSPIKDDECYIICRTPGKKGRSYLGRFHF